MCKTCTFLKTLVRHNPSTLRRTDPALSPGPESRTANQNQPQDPHVKIGTRKHPAYRSNHPTTHGPDERHAGHSGALRKLRCPKPGLVAATRPPCQLKNNSSKPPRRSTPPGRDPTAGKHF